MSNKLTLSQLEQYLSKAAWILKGPVDASDQTVEEAMSDLKTAWNESLKAEWKFKQVLARFI